MNQKAEPFVLVASAVYISHLQTAGCDSVRLTAGEEELWVNHLQSPGQVTLHLSAGMGWAGTS